ncbi:MAG: hypothetical protein WCY75_06990 [Sulfurimonadaceae bacterium]
MKKNIIIGVAILGSFILNLIFTVLLHKDLSNQIRKVPTTTNVTEKYYVTKNELQRWQKNGDSEKIQDGAIELEPIELENGDRILEIKE